MSKRLVLGVALLAVLAGLSLVLAHASGASKATQKPNVLIIISDDQPDGTMGHMPNVSRIFGNGGVEYPNGYASTALCCPARASIMTGQHVHNHTVDGNSTLKTSRFPIARSVQWQLQQRGYTTSLFGKFLNGWESRKSVRGFSTYWGNKGGRFENDRDITRHFIHFINQQEASGDNKPWFTILGYHSPHGPWREPGKPYPWTNKPPSYDEADLSDKPPYMQDRKNAYDSDIANGIVPSNEQVRQGQLREIDLLDGTINTAFRYLARKGESRNTLAFYIADQGYLWGQHGVQGKFLPYLEVLQVPFYMRWPAQIQGGTPDTRLVSSVDIAPTIYDALGIVPSYTPDGRSMLSQSDKRNWLYAEMAGTNENKPWISYITPSLQYIETRYDGNLYKEYYNLQTDPFEIQSELPGGGTSALQSALAAASTCEGASECH